MTGATDSAQDPTAEPSKQPTGAAARATDPDCLFCKIVAGQIPATVVHEDEATVAFRDLDPHAPTHVLVIPRHHVATAAGLAAERPEDAAALLVAVAQVAAQEGVADTGYRTVFNTGADAQQSVFHAHLHVLGGRAMAWPPG
ncbi:histidine triad nucleotide-binding protein [Pedococcus aerophilus]|uniref:Histidine triad nucleotide-binding protein n=1 Tax=Pedococcus aerophilus TaxID=436356 RepID=A0ABP6HEB3_9MICO